MPEFTCPICDTDNDVDREVLPVRACDDVTYQCQYCEQEMKIGWVPEIEVKTLNDDSGDLVGSLQ